jgi:hypothetical protein
LLAYADGRLPEEASETLAAHFDSCADCQAALATLDEGDDTFVAQLRSPAPADPYLEESECRLAVARAVAATETAGQSPAPAAGRSVCGRVLGEYELIEELGHGGMGRVYKALHTKLDRVVALKVLTLGRVSDHRAVARFEREMKAIGKLDHRHIVRAYDAREIEGTPTLIMEYIEGLDLAEIVRRLGPLPASDACEMVRQAALGLQYVHEHGLVHRDIKPSNLMLTPQGEIKILDLGLARFHLDQSQAEETAGTGQTAGGEMTGTDQAMGTADYMAPEQISNSRAADIRADIYSLGCTLYKLLAGRAPFDDAAHQGPAEKMAAHAGEMPPSIRQFRPDIPDGLAAVLDRMLARIPEARYSVPVEVADALAPWCASADLAALLRRAAEGEGGPGPGEERRSQPARAARAAQRPRLLPASRRWPWIAAILGLLLSGGLGLAMAIIIHIRQGDQEVTIEPPPGGTVRVGADGQVNIEVPAPAKVENSFLATQLREAKAGNFWAKYALWAAYRKGTNDVEKNPEETRKWLAEVVKGAYLATFRPAHGFAPETPGEFIAKFAAHSTLQSEPKGLGGASFFRTRAKDGVLIGSFLTAYPDKMRRAIADNPSLELISIEKLTPEMFIRHEASPQESLDTGKGGASIVAGILQWCQESLDTTKGESQGAPNSAKGNTPGDLPAKPRIVSMDPPNGAKDVDPKLRELRVTFDVPMGAGLSWCGGGPSFPALPPDKHATWTEDRKTCVLPVELKPGWNYRLGLNSPSFSNFKSAAGIPLDPVEFAFTTRAASSGTSKDARAAEERAVKEVAQRVPEPAGKDSAEKQALAAADAWLALVDDGKYAESWDAAAQFLKNAVSKDDFVKSLGAARKPLGKMKSREVQSKEYRTGLPGAPDGQYVVIQFKTALENKQSAVETITPMLDKDKKWRVSGYYVR